MNKTLNSLLVIWCAFTSLITSFWLTVTFLNITGLIYQYDYSMDEGTAGIIGGIAFVLWLVLALLPDIVLLKRAKAESIEKLFITLGMLLLFVVIGFAICNWNVVVFLTG